MSVSIGGTSYTVEVNAEKLTRYEVGPFALDAGSSCTLTFAEVKTTDFEGLAIDDVEVYADAPEDDGNLIRNPSFSEGEEAGFTTNGWTVTATGECVVYATETRTQTVNGNNWGYYYGTLPFDGDERFKLTKKESLSQTTDIPEAGTYVLEFHCVSRVWNGEVKNGPLPFDVTVTQSGATRTVASSVSASDTYTGWQKFVYEIDLAAGPCTLAFTGTASNDRTTLIDAVSLRRKKGNTASKPFPADAVVNVAAGASLVLDFAGTNTVSAVRYGGRRAGRVVEQDGSGPYAVVSSSTEGGFVSGEGVLRYRIPRGFIVTFR